MLFYLSVDESRALTISTVRKKGSGRNVLLPDANDEDEESAKNVNVISQNDEGSESTVIVIR